MSSLPLGWRISSPPLPQRMPLILWDALQLLDKVHMFFFVFAIYVISLVFYIIILKHWVKMGLLCIIFHMYSPFAEYKILALVFKKILTLSFTIHPVGHSSCNIKIFLMIFFWNSIYCIYLIACVDSFILFFGLF